MQEGRDYIHAGMCKSRIGLKSPRNAYYREHYCENEEVNLNVIFTLRERELPVAHVMFKSRL